MVGRIANTGAGTSLSRPLRKIAASGFRSDSRENTWRGDFPTGKAKKIIDELSD